MVSQHTSTTSRFSFQQSKSTTDTIHQSLEDLNQLIRQVRSDVLQPAALSAQLSQRHIGSRERANLWTVWSWENGRNPLIANLITLITLSGPFSIAVLDGKGFDTSHEGCHYLSYDISLGVVSGRESSIVENLFSRLRNQTLVVLSLQIRLYIYTSWALFVVDKHALTTATLNSVQLSVLWR